jgi:hypothetical protein
MHQTRDLLLDCRTALRRADPRFENTPLKGRLDSVIVELGQAGDASRALERVQPGAPAAARVAYAWQSATRELRQSHPEIYEHLWNRVLKRLDAKTMDDSTQEIDALQRSLENAQQALSAAEGELGELRAALVAAVANPTPGPSAPDGNGVHALPDRAWELEAPAAPAAPGPPGPALFHAVAAGMRSFTPDELEWCLSEAMVHTGFQRTPVQLLEQGEAGLARLLLETAAAA